MASIHRASARRLAHRGLLTLAAALLATGLASAGAGTVEPAQVIPLTQTGCQFLEPEGTDHGYKTTKKADCDAINAKTAPTGLPNPRSWN